VVDELTAAGGLDGNHRVHVVRAHLLERSGDAAGAREQLAEAVRRAPSLAERRHLERRLRELDVGP
jgi:predicted RNA polymerase sigma factor